MQKDNGIMSESDETTLSKFSSTLFLNALNKLSTAMVDTTESIEEILPETLQEVVEALEYQKAVIYTIDESGSSLEIFISTEASERENYHTIEIDPEEPIELIADTREAIIPEDELANSICLPLLFQEIPYGILCLSQREEAISDNLSDMLNLLATQLSIALHFCFTELSEQNDDYEIISEFTEDDAKGELISEKTPNMVDFAASLQLLRGIKGGGDFHDFLHLPNNKIAITIGKSSGWGEKVEKTLEFIIPLIREKLQSGKTLSETISLLNEKIIEKSERGTLISIAMMILDTRTRKVTITRAGSVKMFRFKGGSLAVFDEGLGAHLGAFSGVKIKEIELQFAPEDSFAIMTDGINSLSEQNNYSLDQITNDLSSAMQLYEEKPQIADKIAELLKQRHLSYTPELDITVFSLQRRRKPKSISQRLFRKKPE